MTTTTDREFDDFDGVFADDLAEPTTPATPEDRRTAHEAAWREQHAAQAPWIPKPPAETEGLPPEAMQWIEDADTDEERYERLNQALQHQLAEAPPAPPTDEEQQAARERLALIESGEEQVTYEAEYYDLQAVAEGQHPDPSLPRPRSYLDSHAPQYESFEELVAEVEAGAQVPHGSLKIVESDGPWPQVEPLATPEAMRAAGVPDPTEQ